MLIIGSTQKAIDSYTNAIKINQIDATPYFERGLLLEFEGNTAQAIEDFKLVARLDPLNMRAIMSLANHAFANKKWDDAQLWYTKYADVHPENVSVHLKRGRARTYLGHWDEALEVYYC